MRHRVLVLLVAVAATLLEAPSLQAVHYVSGGYPRYAGWLREDNSCPGATYAVYDSCTNQRVASLAFHRMKGVNRFTNDLVVLFGPSETVACGKPVVEVKYIYGAIDGPGPCPP